MKTALIVRHVPYEGVAGFAAPIEAAGYALDGIDVGDPALADVDVIAPDLLVLMGGPMSVYEREAHPWLTCEIAKLAARLEAGSADARRVPRRAADRRGAGGGGSC